MDDHLNSLYEIDALIWTEHQIALLRAGEFDQLDLENIISELGYQVRRDKNEIGSRLCGLMTHLLKYLFQPQRRSHSWTTTINNHRAAIMRRLRKMPSLRSQMDEYVADEYPRAVRNAIHETCLPRSAFPQQNPYTTDQILDEDFFPAPNEKAADS
jgi:hypothetical protein